MATIERFEDIKAWQTARELVNAIYEVSNSKEFKRDFSLRDQIRRAAGSCMHNIAEGFDSGSNAEFIRFLRYALRSASETQSQLYTALDQAYISKEKFIELYDKSEKAKRYLHGFIAYLTKNNSRRSIRDNSGQYQVILGDDNDLVDMDP